MRPSLLRNLAFGLALSLGTSLAIAQQTLVIKPLAERRVADLPPGVLFWRIENFGSLEQATAVATPWSLIGGVLRAER